MNLNKRHRPRKRFGQNFLQDESIIHNIISTINAQENEHIVEIGPGLGALSNKLIHQCQHLTLIEIDRDIVNSLNNHFKKQKKLYIYNEDALTFNYQTLFEQLSKKLRIVGNLPYNISSPLLFYLLRSSSIIKDMTFMLQKEFVQRASAKAGSKKYGRLSIMLQYHYQVEYLFDVPPEAFDPQPKVNSAVIRLVPFKQKPFPCVSYKHFEKLVKTAFGQRRKTLSNSLKQLVNVEDFAKASIDRNNRPEELTLEKWVQLSNICSS